MIEAVIAIALIAVCAGTVMAAIVAMQHQAAHAEPGAELTLSAQNVLTDLRAATAYDAAKLAGLAGRSSAFDMTEPAPGGSQTLHVVVNVATSPASGRTVASVTVRNALGQAARVECELAQEAPAPDSVLGPMPPASGAMPGRGPGVL